MMTVAELVARFRADTSDFTRGVHQAERSLDHLDRHSSRVGASLRSLGQTMSSVASGVAIAASLATASLVKVGVTYNTLMQRTTAAFSVLLGEASKANAMVEELTVFARSSPFPRQLFIAGAQQLIGFGVAAKNVIPIFSAIQDAVAAVGGGAEEISRFTNIFARIKSLGHASSEELMRFSEVGIDAFKILAQAAGTSVSEIRKQVHDRTLDADRTIELLMTGLTGKFAGAASKVKETWVGAKDRIAGAWRDIGSKLLAPFINPNGGGAAVKWANQFADLLRKLESRAVVPLAAAMKRLIDDVSRVTDKIDLDGVIDKGIALWQKYGDTLTTLTPILAGVALGFTKQGLGMLPVIGNFLEFLPLPGKIVGALLGLFLATEEGRESLSRMGAALKDGMSSLLPKILPLLADLTKRFAALLPAITTIALSIIDIGFPILAEGVTIAAHALQILLAILQPVANLLADHPGLVRLIIAVWAGFKIMGYVAAFQKWRTALMAWTAASNAAAASSVRLAAAQGIGGVGVGAQMGAAAVGGSRLLTILGKIGPAISGFMASGIPQIAAVIYAFSQVTQEAQDAKDAAQSFADTVTADIDTTSLDGLYAGLTRIGDAAKEARENAADIDPNSGRQSTVQSLWGRLMGNETEAEATQRELREAALNTAAAIAKAELALAAWAKSAGTSVAVARHLANVYEVDLTGSIKDVATGLNTAKKTVMEANQWEKTLAASLDLTVAQFREQKGAVIDASTGLMTFFGVLKAAPGATSDVAQLRDQFLELAGTIVGLPSQMAEANAAIGEGLKGFYNPRAVYGSATGIVNARIEEDHSRFVDGLRDRFDAVMDNYRREYDALNDAPRGPHWAGTPWVKPEMPDFDDWVAQTKGATTEFDEWAANINGANFDEFQANLDKARMYIDEFLHQNDVQEWSTAEWMADVRKIASRGLEGAKQAQAILEGGASPESFQFADMMANMTDVDWKAFVDDVQLQLDQAAEAQGLHLVVGLQVAMGGVKQEDIAKVAGVSVADLQRIAQEAGTDFGKVMEALALAAKNPDATSNLTEFAEGLVGILGDNLPAARDLLTQYAGLFGRFGLVLNDTSTAWERLFGEMPGPWAPGEGGMVPHQPVIGPTAPSFPGLTAPKAPTAPSPTDPWWESLPGFGIANGGIVKFARGGFSMGAESHLATIARAGENRLWAEPETGGEAYIPLALAKRSRSMEILAEVARQFGATLVPAKSGSSSTQFANGGIVGGSHTGASTGMAPRSVNQTNTFIFNNPLPETPSSSMRKARREASLMGT